MSLRAVAWHVYSMCALFLVVVDRWGCGARILWLHAGRRARIKWLSRAGMGSTSTPWKPAAPSHPL
jgi:hypothetical protein